MHETPGTWRLRGASSFDIAELISVDGVGFDHLHATADESIITGSEGCCKQPEDCGRIGTDAGYVLPTVLLARGKGGGGGSIPAGYLNKQ